MNIIPEIRVREVRVREVNMGNKDKDSTGRDLREKYSMDRDPKEKNSMCRDLTDKNSTDRDLKEKNSTDRDLKEKNSIDRDLGDFRDLRDKVSSSIKKVKEDFWVLKVANVVVCSVVGDAPEGADLFVLLLEPLWKLFQATRPRIRIAITIATKLSRTIMIAVTGDTKEVRYWEYGRTIHQIGTGTEEAIK